MSYVPIENFYKGPLDRGPKPPKTLGEIVARLFTFINPAEAPAHMSEHNRGQTGSVAVDQTVEVVQVQV